jgi:hypothetical protein
VTRFAQHFVDEDLSAYVRNPKSDPSPWAAYSTGLQTQIVPLLLATAGMATDMGAGCFDGIPIAVYEVGLACDVLAGVGLQSVCAEIRRVLGELDIYNDALERGWHAGRQHARELTRERLLADSLAVLADRVIPNHLALADAARQVGDEHLRCLPELNELGGLVNQVGGESELGLRQLFVARLGLDGPLDDLDPWEASPFLTNKLWQIARRVNAYLQGIVALPSLPSSPEVPRWHEAEGKLYFRGECVREVVPQAKNIRCILRCLQDQGWPATVDTPLKGESRKDAIKSYNEFECAVELYRAHAEGVVGWRERPARLA